MTADDGVSQEQLRDDVEPVLSDGVEAVTGDDAADESASDLMEAISFLTTFLLIFAGHLAGRRRVPDRQHLLDPGRPAQPRARAAARARGVQAAGDVVGAARGVRARRARRDPRPRPGRAAGDGHPRALRELRARPLRPAADLRAAHFIASYAVGVLVTMAAAWLPARRTGRIAPVQAMRDDVALPESSLRRRLVLGSRRSPSSGWSLLGARAVRRPAARRLAGRRRASSRSCSASRR